jgi:hypothetical protein
VVVPKRPGKGRLRTKPWKQGKHGLRLKDWLLTGLGGGISRMPYAPEGAPGIKKMMMICKCSCSQMERLILKKNMTSRFYSTWIVL